MKLKSIELYKIDEVPDHILQEVHVLSKKMTVAITDLVDESEPNIVLAAVSFFHAVITNHLVIDDDDAIKTAATQQAKALIGNILYVRDLQKSETKE